MNYYHVPHLEGCSCDKKSISKYDKDFFGAVVPNIIIDYSNTPDDAKILVLPRCQTSHREGLGFWRLGMVNMRCITKEQIQADVPDNIYILYEKRSTLLEPKLLTSVITSEYFDSFHVITE